MRSIRISIYYSIVSNNSNAFSILLSGISHISATPKKITNHIIGYRKLAIVPRIYNSNEVFHFRSLLSAFAKAESGHSLALRVSET